MYQFIAFKHHSILVTTRQPFSGSPGLYAYAFVLSAVIVALLVIFTSMTAEPKYYKVSQMLTNFSAAKHFRSILQL